MRCCVIQCIAHVRSVTWLDSFAVWEDAEELAAEHDGPLEAGLLHQTKRFRRDRVRWLARTCALLPLVCPSRRTTCDRRDRRDGLCRKMQGRVTVVVRVKVVVKGLAGGEASSRDR